MKKIYLSFIFALAAKLVSAQCMMVPLDLDSRVNNSSLIIEGKVISKKSFWNNSHNYIYTSNLVSVTQVLKGDITTGFIEVITDGGTIDDIRHDVEPALELGIDYHGVFIVNAIPRSSQFGYATFQAYGDAQGFIKFNNDGIASEPFRVYSSVNGELKSALENSLNRQISDFDFQAPQNTQGKLNGGIQIFAMPVTSISPSSISAGTASQLTITGSGFGATQGANFVQFRNADDGGATNITPHSTQYVSWSSTQIVVQVPSATQNTAGPQSGQAGTGPVTVNIGGTPNVSSQTLTVNYGHLNTFFSSTLTAQRIFVTRHHGLNGSGGMTWRMFTGFDANTSAKNDFQTAFGTWRCATYINWQIGVTTTVNTIALDGTNVIRFDVGSELPVNVLGRCSSYWSGCFSGGTWNWHVAELDICFDSGANWQFGPGVVGGTQYDFESVALHELGHGHQLGHVIDNPGVMHYSIAGGQIKNTLNGNDIAGGNAVMTRNLSGAVCGNAIMVALTPSTCALAAPVASFNVTSPVCVGQVVNLTDISLNNPNVWSWTMTGGTPGTATTQTTSTTFSTAGTKTITLVSTNGTGSSSPLSKTITVIANPTVIVSSATICSGTSTVLNASGTATSYVWNPGALSGATQTLSPGSTQVYTVVGSVGSCTGNSTGTITVNATPTINAPNATICNGTSTVIVASGATNYTWNPGALSGASQTLNPGSTQVYTISGNTGNCSSNKTLTVTVTNTLNVGVSASSNTICAGDAATLTASGATNYTFNPGAINSNPAVVSPGSTTNYTVNGTTAGCSGNSVITLTVIDCSVGFTSSISGKNFMLYPNPTQGVITIDFGSNYTGKVVVYNSLGQLMLNKNVQSAEKTQLNLSEFSKGIYIVKFESPQGSDGFIKVVRD